MIQKLWVKQFRNLNEVVLDLTIKRDVYIFGNNNQGKTNFLEAIYFLGNGKSPLEKFQQNLIAFNQEEAYLGLDFKLNDLVIRLYLKLKKDKKIIIFNNKPIKSIVQLKREVNIEYLYPEIIQLFREKPEIRRNEINHFCTIFFKEYSSLLSKYEKVIFQKNILLKKAFNYQEIEIWNTQLVHLATKLITYRLEALIALEQVLKKYLNKINPEFSKELKLKYIFKDLDFNNDNLSSYPQLLLATLEKNFKEELKYKYSIYGPHHDDFVVEINNRSLFKFYSRGINRILAILFKLAQMAIIKEKYHSFPVLLLDDLFVEIDAEYKEKLIELLTSLTQVFYTEVAQYDINNLRKSWNIFEMVGGNLKKYE